MLAGDAVVAIWNGITPEGRADFYDWHVREHIPERVAIEGFRSGRRYRAADAATQPEFFTLYELDRFETAQGAQYLKRLNAPTEWTRRATSHFRDTSRGLARVLASHGAGIGGALLTLRFDIDAGGEDEARAKLAALLAQLAASHQIVGAHLCITDDAASGQRTAESRDRTDISAPPAWIILVEACTAAALGDVWSDIARRIASPVMAGVYLLEFSLPAPRD